MEGDSYVPRTACPSEPRAIQETGERSAEELEICRASPDAEACRRAVRDRTRARLHDVESLYGRDRPTKRSRRESGHLEVSRGCAGGRRRRLACASSRGAREDVA